MSDTPRTDAMVKTFEGCSDLAIMVACVNEMQKFERELTAAQAAVKRRDEVIDSIAATINRCLSAGHKLTRIVDILNKWWPVAQKERKQ